MNVRMLSLTILFAAVALSTYQVFAQSNKTPSSFLLEKGRWGVKPASLAVIREKVTFSILEPDAPAGTYTLVKSMIAWVQKCTVSTSKGELTFPARKIVCLIYKTKDGRYFAVLEAKTIYNYATPSSKSTDFNIYQAVGDGYFFSNMPVGTSLVSGVTGETDYLVLSSSTDKIAVKFKSDLIGQSTTGRVR